MSQSLKVSFTLIVLALALNVFLFNHNNITKNDVAKTEADSINATRDLIDTDDAPTSNVSIIDGKQMLTITAKGGYSPKKTIAKADLPTTLVFATNDTFDCSSSVSIPSLNYQKTLSNTSETTLDIPAQPKGTLLKGTCSMGMYSFTIKFE
jgi:hypothetical protein